MIVWGEKYMGDFLVAVAGRLMLGALWLCIKDVREANKRKKLERITNKSKT